VFRLNRTAFRINSFAEADNNAAYWLTKPVEERLRAANFLTRQAYHLAPTATLQLDRTQSAIRLGDETNSVFTEDFQDFLKAFSEHGVDYILVGGMR
jgi:hypothetical protein